MKEETCLGWADLTQHSSLKSLRMQNITAVQKDRVIDHDKQNRERYS